MKKLLALRPRFDSLDSLVLLSAVPGVEGVAAPAIVSPAQSSILTISGTVIATHRDPFDSDRIHETRHQRFEGDLLLYGLPERVRISSFGVGSDPVFPHYGLMRIVTHSPHRGDIELSFDRSGSANSYTYLIAGGTNFYSGGSGDGSFQVAQSGADFVLTFESPAPG
jgi:hypothetical protein